MYVSFAGIVKFLIIAFVSLTDPPDGTTCVVNVAAEPVVLQKKITVVAVLFVLVYIVVAVVPISVELIAVSYTHLTLPTKA